MMGLSAPRESHLAEGSAVVAVPGGTDSEITLFRANGYGFQPARRADPLTGCRGICGPRQEEQ